MSEKADTASLLRALGLCAKAGKLIIGTQQICAALHQGKPVFLVIEANDTSASTHKKLTDKCTFYHKGIKQVQADTITLAASVGHSGELAAVGITDQNLARLVEQSI